jgi:hypothetical protein
MRICGGACVRQPGEPATARTAIWPRSIDGNAAGLGHNQAIFALAHQLLLIAYTLLRHGENYRELGADYFDQKNKPKVVNRLVQRLMRLGFHVTLQEAEAPNVQMETVSSEVAAAVVPAQTQSHELPSDAPVACQKPRRGRPCKCAIRGLPCHHKNSALRTQPPELISMNPL